MRHILGKNNVKTFLVNMGETKEYLIINNESVEESGIRVSFCSRGLLGIKVSGFKSWQTVITEGSLLLRHHCLVVEGKFSCC